jgi:hypothetical protein
VHHRLWGHLLQTVTTGAPGFESAFGADVWQSTARSPALAAGIDAFMNETGGEWFPAVAAAYDFTGITTLVDVGGGHGALLAAILTAHPKMRGVLLDLPHTTADAPRLLAAADVAERCTVIGGDFFASVPEGGDALMLGRVLYNWDDDRALALLNTRRRAVPAHSRLLTVEQVLPPSDAKDATGALINDLYLMLVCGGRMRARAEYGALLTAAGFRLTRVIPTTSLMSIVEAVPQGHGAGGR